MADRPPPTSGLRHVALSVVDLEACVDFYVRLLGMTVEWQPDADDVYLTSGRDNLALHRATTAPAADGQRLDHVGFVLDRPDDVDAWHAFLQAEGVRVHGPPRTHRDGARSFYASDPAGNVVQFLHHPPLSTG